jgi:hypothetical protein
MEDRLYENKRLSELLKFFDSITAKGREKEGAKSHARFPAKVI